MYIVYLDKVKPHSLWETKEEANKQKRVLEDNGYKDIFVGYEEIVADNGYYFNYNN